MKKIVLMLIGVLGLGTAIGQAQTMLYSWENSLEGWSILETGSWTSDGFSTNKGVTDGSYSWKLTTTGVDYGPTLQGPTSPTLALLMANAESVSMDIQLSTNAPAFNWGIQIDLEVNQPGGAGTISVNGYNYLGIYGDFGQNTITWDVSQAARTALAAYPNLPCYLTLSVGGGGGGTIYIDNLRVTKIPQTQGNLWVRELWDSLGSQELIPANMTVTNNSSSVGFDVNQPWAVNPADVANCQLMAFRPGFGNDPQVGDLTMALPGTLDGTSGCMVQENAHGTTAWTDGDFMTRVLNPECFINFQAAGEYWFSMTIANATNSLNAQYVSGPASGAGGLGFANGDTTNASFVAIGATGLNITHGAGAIDASKALYISQGTLGQPGDINSGAVSLTNYIGGPFYISALGDQTVGHVAGDYITLLGHLKTFGDGTATVDAKYYGTGVGGNSWNTELDTNPAAITWDASYSFNFNGTMTRLLLFQNRQFPFYIFGVRASTNFNQVVGLDPGRIQVAPLTDTYVGYPINMTNLAVEANSFSWAVPPSGYGTLNYKWYRDGVEIMGETSQYLNIASASTNNAGTYTCVATDPSGTWGSVSNSVVITVTQLADPTVATVEMFHNQLGFLVTYDEPNLTGAGDLTHYVLDNGITVTNVTVVNSPTDTRVYLDTDPMPLGTKISLTISGVTNVVGGTLATTNVAMWTDLVQPGVANLDAWSYPALTSQNDYFNNFVPNNPTPPILQSVSTNSWEAPVNAITIVGGGYAGDGFGDKLYGWFIPPVTTNYVFFISCDDGGRLSLSTDDTPGNLRVIACESAWNGADQWTNICDQYDGPGSPHRGDGTATGTVGAGTPPTAYVWDNSIAGQSPATACLQNRSDQFIVAFYDSSGLPGGPAGATTSWAGAYSQVTDCVPVGMTNNFWPNVDANGQALITLQAGQMYYMQLEHMEIGGGQNGSVTYKIAGDPDPYSGDPTANPAVIGDLSALTGSVIAGTVPFTPTISIAQTASGPVITYTGVLLAGTNVNEITNVVAQSSATTAISLGGPSQYSPPPSGESMFYRTTE